MGIKECFDCFVEVYPSDEQLELEQFALDSTHSFFFWCTYLGS
jgi:hypothetical protein